MNGSPNAAQRRPGRFRLGDLHDLKFDRPSIIGRMSRGNFLIWQFLILGSPALYPGHDWPATLNHKETTTNEFAFEDGASFLADSARQYSLRPEPTTDAYAQLHESHQSRG